MGGGSYDYISRSTRTEKLRCSSRDEIFTSESRHTHKVTQDMDIKGHVRECHDMDEHPESFPVIIALDVTGSMGQIPERLIKNDFPEIMKKLLDKGVKDPQVCFVGIGDHECDDVPIQVGQFESSDELLDRWLSRIYLEGGGGSNDGESYLLAYYFAAKHTDIDSWNKRGKKGVLITIGDEPCLDSLPKHTVQKLFDGQDKVTLKEILDQCMEKWDVYHINVEDYSGSRESVKNQWKQLLGPHFISSPTRDGKDIIDIIPKIVISSYKNSGGDVKLSKDDEDDLLPFMFMMAMNQQNQQNQNTL